MARHNPSKPGLAALDLHREAFESGRVTATEVAAVLGISRQVANRAIKRKGWTRPDTSPVSATAPQPELHSFTTEEAGDLLVSVAFGVLVHCHDALNSGGLSPSSLKAIAAAAGAAEVSLEKRGIVRPASTDTPLPTLEIRALAPEEEAQIRREIAALAGNFHD